MPYRQRAVIQSTMTPLPFSFPQLEPIAEQRKIARIDTTASTELEPNVLLHATAPSRI